MTRASRLRAIPSVDKVLQALGETGLPSPLVVDAVRRHLQALRAQKSIPVADAIVADIRSSLGRLRASRIAPVINATGVLVHTNLGRAPLAAPAVARVTALSGYSNLEYDLEAGGRGRRDIHAERPEVRGAPGRVPRSTAAGVSP